MNSESPDNRIPLEDRVNILFASLLDDTGQEVQTSVVADRISEVLGRPVLEAELEALRRPGATRPREDLLLALARHFDMPGSFLSEDPDDYVTRYSHLDLLITQRDKRIPYLPLRASADQLSDDAVRELTKYLKSLD